MKLNDLLTLICGQLVTILNAAQEIIITCHPDNIPAGLMACNVSGIESNGNVLTVTIDYNPGLIMARLQLARLYDEYYQWLLPFEWHNELFPAIYQYIKENNITDIWQLAREIENVESDLYPEHYVIEDNKLIVKAGEIS